jgi:hypothetical protein
MIGVTDTAIGHLTLMLYGMVHWGFYDRQALFIAKKVVVYGEPVGPVEDLLRKYDAEARTVKL